MPVSRLARGLVAASAAGLLAVLPMSAPGQTAPPAAPGASSLEAAVSAKLLDHAGASAREAPGSESVVRVIRSRGSWVFGTAVQTAPEAEGAYPEGWLFLAKRQGSSWRVGFDGEPGFAELSAAAPVVSATERKLFASHDGEVQAQANGDYRTGMRLPYGTGQSWYMWGGPHAWDAGSGPWSSIDLAGGDQVVRAARGGTAYTMCRGWIRVVHDRGYSTDYYHLWSNINVNGSWVGAGGYLGYTGTDITCGGSANSRHVHFALRQDGGYVGIAYHIIGKWVLLNGSYQYDGSALHGSRRVNDGGRLYNYGALGFSQGIVDANGGTYLNKRSGPGTGYSIVGSVSDGATVSISCSASGTWHSGRWGGTSMWNRLTDGSWVSDAYLYTGTNSPVSGWC